jgi:hypothetical protein
MLRHKAMQQCARIALGIKQPESTPIPLKTKDESDDMSSRTGVISIEKLKSNRSLQTRSNQLKDLLTKN